MADERHLQKETGAGETHPPPMTAEEFESTPEFRQFRSGMKELLKVSKAELDRRMKEARAESPRIGNLNAPGQKRKSR